MLANTLYLLGNRLADGLGWDLFAVGETSLPRLFQAMVLTHTGLGLLLAALALVFFSTHLSVVWKRRHRASILSGSGFVVVGVALVVTGLFILTAAATRDHRWAWWTHVLCAALIPLGYAAHRRVSHSRPPARGARRFIAAVAAGGVILMAVHGLTRRDVRLTPEARAAMERGLGEGPGGKGRVVSRYAGEGGDTFVPRGFVPPESPFFPSPATTTSGTYLPVRIITRGSDESLLEEVRREVDLDGFATETAIGAETCDRCHPDVTEQWASSAHRFSSFNNPFYEATVNDLRAARTGASAPVARHMREFGVPEDGVGRVKSKWCSGCHDQALMLAGTMDAPIDRGSVEAQAGITCLACHAIDQIHDRTGNGNYNIADEQEDPYLFSAAEIGSWRAFLHDAAIRAKPTVHKRQMRKDFFGTSEFCATCHKVSLTEPVNDYRWLRGQNEYDNWHDSGVSRNAARTFYLPQEARVCQDCHMPPVPAPLGDLAAEDGRVRSHRFLAVNTALPFVRGDTATIRRVEAFLREDRLSVDIFALRTEDSTEPVFTPELVRPRLRPGTRILVDVVVRNRGVGHTFPGGTNDSNEGWLEFSLLDEDGGLVAISGALDEGHRLDPLAHAYKAVILDSTGARIGRRNAQDIHVTAAANLVGPGTADAAHYAFTVPPELAGRRLTLRARLLWRKFDREYTEFAFESNPEGFKRFESTPILPISEIASAEVELEVEGSAGAGADPIPPPRASADWERYNDYGIALLLEGNTRGAAAPFRRVAELQPERVDGPLNLARVALADGNLEAAYDALQRAEEIRPGDARSAWVWGGVLQEDGRYSESAQAYERVLEDFPHDRGAWRQLGRTRYLDRRYEEALRALGRVLEIDPEDRVAHYHRMLSLRAMGRDAEASLAEAAYERYRIDEAAQAVTRAYRAANPGVNLMAQPIHTHELTVRETDPARPG
jgi:tetratricopeptide (TPR) repeat protein